MSSFQKKSSGKTKKGFCKQFKETCRTFYDYDHKVTECLHKKKNKESSTISVESVFTVYRIITGSAIITRSYLIQNELK